MTGFVLAEVRMPPGPTPHLPNTHTHTPSPTPFSAGLLSKAPEVWGGSLMDVSLSLASHFAPSHIASSYLGNTKLKDYVLPSSLSLSLSLSLSVYVCACLALHVLLYA